MRKHTPTYCMSPETHRFQLFTAFFPTDCTKKNLLPLSSKICTWRKITTANATSTQRTSTHRSISVNTYVQKYSTRNGRIGQFKGRNLNHQYARTGKNVPNDRKFVVTGRHFHHSINKHIYLNVSRFLT